MQSKEFLMLEIPGKPIDVASSVLWINCRMWEAEVRQIGEEQSGWHSCSGLGEAKPR